MRHASFWWRGRRPARSGGGAPRPAPLGGGAPRHFEWVFKQRAVAVEEGGQLWSDSVIERRS